MLLDRAASEERRVAEAAETNGAGKGIAFEELAGVAKDVEETSDQARERHRPKEPNTEWKWMSE